MAALINKLFGRKKSPDTETVKPAGPTANQQEKSDRQNDMRQKQLTQLAKSPSQVQLEQLATEGITANIRLSAARALTEEERLQRVQKQSKGKDKGVYQTVRQALQAIRAEADKQRREQQAIATLIENARTQAQSDDTKLYEPRLEALRNKWADLKEAASEAQSKDFLQALSDCQQRLDALNAEKARQAQAIEQKTQRSETLALLKTTLNEIKQVDGESEPSVASLDALQKTQENRWLEATRDTQVVKQEQKNYETLMLPLRSYIAALKRLSQKREAILALTEAQQSPTQNDDDNLQAAATELLATLEWPAEFAMPESLQKLVQLAGQKPQRESQTSAKPKDTEQQKALAETVRETLSQLEQALESRQLKESKTLHKAVQQQFKQLDRRHSQPLQARLQLLGGQLRELHDWQGFATRPKQIALCEQMEYLADQPMEPEAKAGRIKEIQNEWRALGGSSERELWARFKQASDLAYEPCKAYFSAKSGLKQANLEARKTIVEQLETFIANADWRTIDWKAAEQIHQKAREEWKAAWPVEFRDNRPLQKNFDRLLKQLEEPLNQEREKNEALKRDIVARAEALIELEPLAEAMNQAKSLQKDWQQTGITRHREDRKLWQAFRKACDRIFARREDEKAEQQEQEKHAELAESRRNREKHQQWRECIRARAEARLDTSSLPKHWGSMAEALANIDDSELVIRAEILAELPSPPDDQNQRMEIQVRRLAEGLGGKNDAEAILEQMEKLVAAWCLRFDRDSVSSQSAERLIAAAAAVFQQ